MNANELPRREFLKTAAVLAAAGALNLRLGAASAPKPLPDVSPRKLPRWRGFNLLEKFIARESNAPFRESDFAWIAEWGFDFVRLPMSYLCWSSPRDWRQLNEKVLKEIDQAVEFGRQYGIHVCLNFHRAPGYSVDRSLDEPFNLWTDAEALEACRYHWGHFAARYKGVPSARLSFDLINEPATLTAKPQVFLDDAHYARVARALVQAIRAEDPDRLIISDGLLWGNVPVPELADLGIAQSTRGYSPHEVTHYKAEWVADSDKFPAPTWPMPVSPDAGAKSPFAAFREVFRDNPLYQQMVKHVDPAMPWGPDRFKLQQIDPWKALEAMGVGVHVGECGVYNKTPHAVTLAYLGDVTRLWREAGCGFALWNFRGQFGVLDSERADVKYENFKGHQLDRAMLELLRSA